MSFTDCDMPALYAAADEISLSRYGRLNAATAASIQATLGRRGQIDHWDRVTAEFILSDFNVDSDDEDYGTILGDVTTMVARRKWLLPSTLPKLCIRETLPTVVLTCSQPRSVLAASAIGKHLGLRVNATLNTITSPYFNEANLREFIQHCNLQARSVCALGVLTESLIDARGHVLTPIRGLPVLLVHHRSPKSSILVGTRDVAYSGSTDDVVAGIDCGPGSYGQRSRTRSYLWSY